MIKKAGNLFATAYLLLIFGVYPFYMKKGYVDIGEGKYEFVLYCSLGAIAILSVLALLQGIRVMRERRLSKEAYLIDWCSLSVTDLLVFLYLAEITISTLFSDFRQEAIWGTEGWHIGLVLLAGLCCLYLLISRLWDGNKIVWYVSIAASGMVFLLGILDSFSLYVIPLEIREAGFISTLGNINWFCGYLSVLAPIGVCMFLLEKYKQRELTGEGRKESLKVLLYGIYTVIAFMAGFAQGSNSVFLWFFGLLFLLLWFSMGNSRRMADWFVLLSLWGMSGQLVRLMKVLMPGGYNYEENNLCGYFTHSSLTLWIALFSFAAAVGLTYRAEKKSKQNENQEQKPEREWKEDERRQRKAQKILAVTLAAGVVLWVVLSVINTWTDASGFIDNSLFCWNESWGNGRGASLKAGFLMFGELPFLKKLIGAGPDCFAAYAYALPEIASGLRDYFGSSRLTNAHNEIVTSLVNTGILGTALYVGIFVSFVYRCFHTGKRLKQPFLYIAGICVCCYLIHNMVSFAQVLNLPFTFLVIAMGENLLKNSTTFGQEG